MSNPEILGLPRDTRGGRHLSLHLAKLRATEALRRGDEDAFFALALDLYLAGYPIVRVFDEVLAGALRALGEAWCAEGMEVYRERRACEISTRFLHRFRAMLPSVSDSAPCAIGGSLAGDPYSIATIMVELVLRDSGWNATNLGPNLPPTTIRAAMRETKARLLWLSVSAIPDLVEFRGEAQALSAHAKEREVTLVTGGRALTEAVRDTVGLPNYFENLEDLKSFIEQIDR